MQRGLVGSEMCIRDRYMGAGAQSLPNFGPKEFLNISTEVIKTLDFTEGADTLMKCFDPTYYGDFLYRMTYTVCRDVENIQSLLGSFRFLAICSSMIFHRVFDCSKGEVQDFNTKMFQLIEKDEKLMKWIIANKNELQIYMKQLCVHWTNKDYGLAGVAMGSAIKMIKKFLQ
eukprot:TRINITY_DN544_c0_g1_i5.p1 TRINITY_DN544_c0_g1~~TRINITY_DN544_c0_g1_i5.p1  ORF type:complete len:172 (+),score=29.71 TRINITY_DN544_c0_g1_i5:119-634(+)